MKWISVGKVVNTHGIKGEIRILSPLEEELKKKVFQGTIYINKTPYKIQSYRRHKNYDMVTLEGFNNINQVLFLKNKLVEKDPQEIEKEKGEVFDFELMDYKVLTTDGKVGLIKEIEETGRNYKILRLEIEGKEYLITKRKEFILNIDQQNKTITVKLI